MSAHQQGYLVDDCLCDNYLGMVTCFGHEICLCDMLCVLMVMVGISLSLTSVFRIEGVGQYPVMPDCMIIFCYCMIMVGVK